MEIPCSSKEGARVEPPAIPPSQELAVVRSSHDVAAAGSSSGLGATHELVWPCPDDPRKARFILHDKEEVGLWYFLEERGLLMESDLAQTKARLKEALEQVELVHQAVSVDLPCITEVSFLRFLRLSLTPWSFTGCFSMFASRFIGFRGDVDPQVSFPLGGAWSDGVRSCGVTVG